MVASVNADRHVTKQLIIATTAIINVISQTVTALAYHNKESLINLKNVIDSLTL